MNISSALYQYLYQNPNHRYEVRQRQHDGLFNVTRPVITLHDKTSGEHSITWETIGVFDSEPAATSFIKQYFHKNK